jgi:membrane associated rhomboid family serine protease
MIPLTIDVPMKRIPWANWGLILVTVVVSLAVPAITVDWVGAFPAGFLQTRLSPLVLQRGPDFAFYQPLTALFQHADLVHLIGNMLFLFVFGNAINAKLGHLGFLAAYLGIGILENTIWLILGIGSACLGASAAIMGMCGMFLVLYPLNGVFLLWEDFRIMLLLRSWSGELPGWMMVLLYVAYDIWGAIAAPESPVGHVAHLIGAAAGVGLACILLQTEVLTPDPGEQTLLQCLSGEGPTEKPRRRKKRKKVRSVSLENDL